MSSNRNDSMVVLISGSGTNLQALIDACEAGHIAGQISLVISNRQDAKGLQRAANHKINHRCIDHKDYADRDAFDQALIKSIDEQNPRLVVLAGFMRILTAEFVNHYQGRLINIHPSLLPNYKGLNTHQRVIDAGDSEHGCSVHYVTQELDGGPIIGQRKISVQPDDNADSLAQRVHQQEHILYPLVCKLIMAQRLSLKACQPWLDTQPLPDTGKDFSDVIDWTSY